MSTKHFSLGFICEYRDGCLKIAHQKDSILIWTQNQDIIGFVQRYWELHLQHSYSVKNNIDHTCSVKRGSLMNCAAEVWFSGGSQSSILFHCSCTSNCTLGRNYPMKKDHPIGNFMCEMRLSKIFDSIPDSRILNYSILPLIHNQQIQKSINFWRICINFVVFNIFE